MEKKSITLPGVITVGDLATKLDIPVTKLIGELFKNGIAATINQRIDFETATIIVDELGLDVELQKKEVSALALHLPHRARCSQHSGDRYCV